MSSKSRYVIDWRITNGCSITPSQSSPYWRIQWNRIRAAIIPWKPAANNTLNTRKFKRGCTGGTTCSSCFSSTQKRSNCKKFTDIQPRVCILSHNNPDRSLPYRYSIQCLSSSYHTPSTSSKDTSVSKVKSSDRIFINADVNSVPVSESRSFKPSLSSHETLPSKSSSLLIQRQSARDPGLRRPPT